MYHNQLDVHGAFCVLQLNDLSTLLPPRTFEQIVTLKLYSQLIKFVVVVVIYY